MAKPFRLNKKGVGAILKEAKLAAAVTAVAEDLVAAVRTQVGDNVTVHVDAYTTDRGAAAAVIAHEDGVAMQASDGALTKAAAAVGLTVTAK